MKFHLVATGLCLLAACSGSQQRSVAPPNTVDPEYPLPSTGPAPMAAPAPEAAPQVPPAAPPQAEPPSPPPEPPPPEPPSPPPRSQIDAPRRGNLLAVPRDRSHDPFDWVSRHLGTDAGERLLVSAEDESDFRLTETLRRQLMDDASLTRRARNIRIRTVDGIVTLSGEVSSRTERAVIVSHARRLAGMDQVRCFVEVRSRVPERP